MPIAEFGGVEKTAYNLAAVMRDHGWSTHLFVFCKQAAQPAALIAETFESINFLCDAGVATLGSGIAIYGFPLSELGDKGTSFTGAGFALRARRSR